MARRCPVPGSRCPTDGQPALAAPACAGLTPGAESGTPVALDPAMIESVLQDLRYATRSLARQPRYTIAALFTLTLGIGVNAAIYSVVNAVLVRPLLYADADR